MVQVTALQGISAVVNSAGGSVVYINGVDGLNDDQRAAISGADIAVVVVGTSSAEGADRLTLALGNGQDELVSAVVELQPNTVVVVTSPGAALLPWLGEVRKHRLLVKVLCFAVN